MAGSFSSNSLGGHTAVNTGLEACLEQTRLTSPPLSPTGSSRHSYDSCKQPPAIADRPATPTAQQGTPLLQMPVEIILDIVDLILDSFELDPPPLCTPDEAVYLRDDGRFYQNAAWRTVASLAATCRDLNMLITPTLYKKDLWHRSASALILSAKNNRVPGILKSLEHGAYIDTEDWTDFSLNMNRQIIPFGEKTPVPVGMTSLHWAAFRRHLCATKALLQLGADIDNRATVCIVNDRDKFICGAYREALSFLNRQFAPSMAAARKVFDETYELLFGYGANALYFALKDVDDVPDSHQSQHVRSRSSVLIAELLVEANASLITHTAVGLHALHQACGSWDVSLVRFFLELGRDRVDPNVRDAFGNTPFHYLAMCRPSRRSWEFELWAKQVVGLLLQHGADINAVNSAGQTPLHMCLRPRPKYYDINIYPVIALLTAGADIFPGFISGLQQTRRSKSNVGWATWVAMEKGESSKTLNGNVLLSRMKRAEEIAANVWLYKICRDGGLSGFVHEDIERWDRIMRESFWTQVYADLSQTSVV